MEHFVLRVFFHSVLDCFVWRERAGWREIYLRGFYLYIMVEILKQQINNKNISAVRNKRNNVETLSLEI